MTPKLNQITCDTGDGTPLVIDTQRVRTLSYGWPRRPFVTEYMGADREDLLIAAHAAAQGQELTSELIRQLGQDYVSLTDTLNRAEERALVAEQQLAVTQGIADGLQMRLAGMEFSRDMTEDLYEAELAERVRISGLHAELSARLAQVVRLHGQVSLEALHLRHQLAGTTPVSVEIALDQQFDDSEETQVVDMHGGGR